MDGGGTCWRLFGAVQQARDSRSTPVLVDDHHALLVFDTIVRRRRVHLAPAPVAEHPAQDMPPPHYDFLIKVSRLSLATC